MNLFTDIRSLVLDTLARMQAAGQLPEGLDMGNVTVEPPRDPAHGDMATNAAMVLAKPAGLKPRDIAATLADMLAEDGRVAVAEVAGPGFLNLRLVPALWHGVLRNVLEAGPDFGRSSIGQGKRVNVEYVSANPTGPLHVGHTRGAVFGDALASLLDFVGYDVTREYYINDGGAQVDVLARSVYLRYLEAHGQEVAFADGTYPGDYLIEVGRALKDKVNDAYVGQPEEVWLEPIRVYATEAMMDLIRADLKALGVEMDVFYSEKSLYGTGLIEAAIEDLRGKGLIYRGVLEPPKGKMPEDWEPREQTLFKSTEHGDDVDRPIMKSEWPGAGRYQAGSTGQALQERRAVQDVEARGHLRDAARRGRSGGRGCDPLCHADAQERCAARFRFRAGDGAIEGQPGVLRPICQCAGELGAAQGAARGDRGGRCHAGGGGSVGADP
jgi:arginyl-tRNA synthetase